MKTLKVSEQIIFLFCFARGPRVNFPLQVLQHLLFFQAAVTFFDMTEYYEACLKLNISYNKNIGHRGWQACARMLRKASLAFSI